MPRTEVFQLGAEGIVLQSITTDGMPGRTFKQCIDWWKSLLDDMDSRVAHTTATFLLKRMMTEEPRKYQRILQNLVFKAVNNEKLLENPYLEMRGIFQLSSECGSPSFQSES
ncbi:hypothetical protein R1sor_013576 [Riccia sorocarpa]|uniref:Uncharacterized protein n=1 Tax=Riccia sorocarpa TaxID=122646 RepID=A0ABD3H9X3_9MARC